MRTLYVILATKANPKGLVKGQLPDDVAIKQQGGPSLPPRSAPRSRRAHAPPHAALTPRSRCVHAVLTPHSWRRAHTVPTPCRAHTVL
eukprot:7384278-Prymnesium_polylepis.1